MLLSECPRRSKEWGNEAARVPCPAPAMTYFEGALVLKDAWLLGLLGFMPCRLNRLKIVPGSKASSILDVIYLVRSCETASYSRPYSFE